MPSRPVENLVGDWPNTEQAGEGYLGQVEGLADLGDLALGFPCLGGVAALALRIDRAADDAAIRLPFQTEHAGGGTLAPHHDFFPGLEHGDIRGAVGGASRLGFGGGGDGFHGA